MKEARDIVNVFNRQGINRTQLESQQKLHHVKKGLDRNAETRISSNCTMLSSLLINKGAPISTVVLPTFEIGSSQRMQVCLVL